jgi:glucose-1-phosphate adenylyltransferase
MPTFTRTLHLPLRKSQNEKKSTLPVDMNRVAAIILGGGKGTRLFPLTQCRCKPAISFGGRYRLIDVPISNSINSGCHKIFVITQFLSSSLHQHIFQTYRQDIFSNGFLEMLPAEQRHEHDRWFEGTADAVRQNRDYFIDTPVDYFLILSGDQLYKMDFRRMVQFAKQTDADMVVGALPISKQDAKRMGVLKIDKDHFITNFHEKPQEEEILEKMASFYDRDTPYSVSRPYLGSMGIYLFKREALLSLLEMDTREDFGKHLIPTKVRMGNAVAFLHEGYWEDIGTIASFYEANLALTQESPIFNTYEEAWPVFSCRYNLPGPKIHDTHVVNSIICEGGIIEAKEISNSILGPRTVVKKGCEIRGCYFIGNDFYRPPLRTDRLPEELHIGENCVIHKAILDKHVCLGNNVRLINKNNLENYSSDDVYIRDGIIVVPRGSVLPNNFVL